MIFLLIVGCLLLATVGLLLLPLQLHIDSRVPLINLRWKGVGKTTIYFENEQWRLRVVLGLFRREWPLDKIIFGKKGRKNQPKKSVQQQKKKKKSGSWQRMIRILQSFRVSQWQLALDPGDYTHTAFLYPLNYAPGMKDHLYINFLDENYLVATLTNSPWRLIYAWVIKK